MAELPVVAAGSLLDFALEKHVFSIPVGRIDYMYLEPLSFEEFLTAIGQQELRIYLESYDWKLNIPKAIHLELMKRTKEFLIVGGMPAAVTNWATQKLQIQLAKFILTSLRLLVMTLLNTMDASQPS